MKITFTLVAALLLCAPLHAAERTWPDVRFATQKEGSFPSIERLRSLHDGMTKTQVREILGSPHFWEGPFRSMQWNYLLHFRSPDSLSPPRSCRLQIDFNNKAEVTGYVWLPADCRATYRINHNG